MINLITITGYGIDLEPTWKQFGIHGTAGAFPGGQEVAGDQTTKKIDDLFFKFNLIFHWKSKRTNVYSNVSNKTLSKDRKRKKHINQTNLRDYCIHQQHPFRG